jgi:hypothetical protein
MPHSWHFPTTLIQDKVQRLAPQSVVDVGAGYGKWGLLLREQLDWNLGRLDRDRWTARIVGIEVFPYESPLHGWVYDEVIHADVLDVIDRIDGYDLVLLSDVIEHIEKGPALGLLRRLVAQNRNVIVCTPLDFFEQEIHDNEHEHHVSHWTIDDFSEFVFDYDTASGAAMVVSLAGKGAAWPTTRDRAFSRGLYKMPWLGRHSLAARAVKQAVRRT